MLALGVTDTPECMPNAPGSGGRSGVLRKQSSQVVWCLPGGTAAEHAQNGFQVAVGVNFR